MIWRLNPDDPLLFPDPEKAPADDPLAIGGDLSPERLMAGYSLGIFPWYAEGSPILWWSPDPRCVILREHCRLPRTVRRAMQKFAITLDQNFPAVISGCAHMLRSDHAGGFSAETWIVDDMQSAYIRLHELGFAHSVEAWDAQGLAGGLYGVCLGRIFFGESMFHLRPDASKAALGSLLTSLWDAGYLLLDCQMQTKHIIRYGAENLPRHEFLRRLAEAVHDDLSQAR